MDRGPFPSGAGVAVGLVAMVLCCALPLLILSGGIGVTAAWLFDGGVIWLLFVAILVFIAGGVYFRRKFANEMQRSRQHESGRPED